MASFDNDKVAQSIVPKELEDFYYSHSETLYFIEAAFYRKLNDEEQRLFEAGYRSILA